MLAGTVSAQHQSQLREGGSLANLNLPGYGDQPQNSKVYIVQLKTPSAAEYQARIVKSGFGNTFNGSQKVARTFDKNSASIQSYTQRLTDEQDRVLTKTAPSAEKIYSYLFGLNGFGSTSRQNGAHAGSPACLGG